jgi:hypothetical protein
MRRLTQTLLLALVLVAIQIASIAHQHGGDTLPSGQQSAVCDFCTGIHAGAPAPEPAAAAHHAPALLVLPAAIAQLALPARPPGAHGSRAPPAIHSI